ncbi:MAG: ATP-binding protein [Pyrobaculum sp.]|jgi:magnesium chelatase subunit D
MVSEVNRVDFPFTAIVGNVDAKLALILNAIDPDIGGVLLVGDKGTGKSTMVRSLANVLPEIEVVADCSFNDDPRDPMHMCELCYQRYVKGEELPVVKRRMRVVNLPLSITVDRLVGTIDIKRALREGIRALQPGLLAEANRNILYIDEVNLLDDYTANLLLDVAASGWNIIEREGFSFRHPAKFVLVGSMNPEEGELRPQILDRFGLYVNVETSKDPEERVEIIRRVEEFRKDPILFMKRYEPYENELRERISRAKDLVRNVEIDDELLKFIAKVVTDMGIRTHRAEIVTVRAAKALAAFNGRTRVELEDVKRVMRLTLPHRIKAKPFDKAQGSPNFNDLLNQIFNNEPRSDRKNHNNNTQPMKSLSTENADLSGGEASKEHGNLNQASKELNRDSGLTWRGVGPNNYGSFRRDELNIITGLDLTRVISGWGDLKTVNKCSKGNTRYVIGGGRGIAISYVIPKNVDEQNDIDINATINAAVIRNPTLPISIEPMDFRVKLRLTNAPTLIAILLDLSGSMSAKRKIEIAKGIIKRLIEDSYIKRTYLTLITFRGLDAEVLMQPTRHYGVLYDVVDKLPIGGATPLPVALAKLLTIARSFKLKYRDSAIYTVLITDGKANVPLRRSVAEDLKELCDTLLRVGVDLTIYPVITKSLDPVPNYIEHLVRWCGARIGRFEVM